MALILRTFVWCIAMAANAVTDRTDQASDFLNTREAAAFLGVQPRFIQRLRAERRVPCYKLGKHLRFRRSDLATWAEANRQDVAG